VSEECACINTEKDFSNPSFLTSKENLSSIVVTLKGENFQFSTLNGLYLSSTNYLLSTLELDLFTNIKSLSSKFPKISAFPVNEYEVYKVKINHYEKFGTKERYDIKFRLPSELLDGNYDIIFINNAGYSKASNFKNFTYFSVVETTSTPTPTPTHSPTPTPTPSQTPQPTPTSSETPQPTPTLSQTPTPSQTNPILSFVPNFYVEFNTEPLIDSDNDGYTDSAELSAGTDPNDPNNFPITLFNVFNNI
jgi:hypothetical protein